MFAQLGQVVRSVAKPAAMVGIVGMLSLSLIVTTPSTAQALTPKLPVTPTFVMGAVKTVAPVAMAAVSVTPIGWGLRLFQLGMLAYSTSDMWMPFVTGTFGTPQTDVANPSPNVLPGFRLAGLAQTGPRSISFSYTYQPPNPNGTKSGYPYHDYQCRQTVAQAGKPVGTVFQSSFTWSVGLPVGASGTLSGNACPLNSEIISGYVGKGSGLQEPENTLYTGGGVGAFDPRGNDVLYRGSSECIDSAGVISWVTGPDVPGDNGAMLMPSCEKAGKGHGTGRTKVEAFKPDGSQETVWDTGPTPLSDPATPLCDPGRATSGCVLEVTKDGQPCKSGDVECENWSEESQQENNTRYGCKLGPYTLPLSACSLLEKAYRPGGSPLNDENTDGNPSTSSPLGPAGQPAPAPAPITNPSPGGNPAAVPGGAGQTGPGADDQSKNCYPTGWAVANPVEWVLKPVGCALRAAFVPSSQAVQAQGQRVQTKLATVGFGPMTTAFLGTVDAGVAGSGCMGPEVSFDMMGVHHSFHPFQACSQPMSTVAGITNAVSAIGIVLFGGLGMIRALSSAFGFNFTMGSKGGVDA